MISLTIDTSVFILPPENDDIEIEYKNVDTFYSNILKLNNLEKCSSITVSYMNKIPDNLIAMNYYPYRLRERVNKLNKNNYFPKLPTNVLLDIYKDLLKKLSIDVEFGKKGKIGIYENIPGKKIDPDEKKYADIKYDKCIYSSEYGEYLSKIFNTYLGFIAELNLKYFSENDNYIAISGSAENIKSEIEMNVNGDKSNVNVIGIQKASALIKNKDYENIHDVIIELDTCGNIIYGTDADLNNIKPTNTSKKEIYTKLFYYISTINNIVDIMKNNNLSIMNDIDWMFILNAHGCLCSPDNPIYMKCPNEFRKFKDNKGNKKYFSLHLKPVTNYIKGKFVNQASRIYFLWNGSKILIGYTGDHPISCSGDPNSDCFKVNCQYKPKSIFS